MNLHHVTLAVAIIAGLIPVACSGNEEPPSDIGERSGTPLSKEEFIERADGICDTTEHRLQALEPAATTDGLEDYADAIGAISDEAITELRSLEPPSEDKEIIARLIENIERSVNFLPEYARAAQSQDSTRFREIEAELQEIADQSAMLAREYGFKQCGGDEGSPTQ